MVYYIFSTIIVHANWLNSIMPCMHAYIPSSVEHSPCLHLLSLLLILPSPVAFICNLSEALLCSYRATLRRRKEIKLPIHIEPVYKLIILECNRVISQELDIIIATINLGLHTSLE